MSGAIPSTVESASSSCLPRAWRHRRDASLPPPSKATSETPLSLSPSQALEQLEQMRALEAGMAILVGEVQSARSGVDTREDYEMLQRVWREREGSARRSERAKRAGATGI